MNVIVSILGRAAVDQPFAEIVAPSKVVLAGDWVAYTPSLPESADGQELRLRVLPDNGLTVAFGTSLDPTTRPGPTPLYDGAGNHVRTDPAPGPAVTRAIAVWGGQTRDIAISPRETAMLVRNGINPANLV